MYVCMNLTDHNVHPFVYVISSESMQFSDSIIHIYHTPVPNTPDLTHMNNFNKKRNFFFFFTKSVQTSWRVGGLRYDKRNRDPKGS